MEDRPTLLRSRIEHMGADRSRCGYCHSQNTSHNYGVWAHRLDVTDYQNLLDAGWRRSGSYLYRPNLSTTCCPTYVIRLDAHRFTPSSTHKRVLKRLRRFTSPGVHRPTCSPVTRSGGSRISLLEDQRLLVLEAVQSVLDRLSRDASLDPPLESLVLKTVRDSAKVFPPKQRSTKRASKEHGAQASMQAVQPTNTSVPHFASNVALALAAAERHTARLCAVQPQAATRDSQRREPDKRELTARQVALAEFMSKFLNESLKDVASVTVTSPGFLNFWLRKRLTDAEDPMPIEEAERVETENANEANLAEKHRVIPNLGRESRMLGRGLVKTIEVSDVSEIEISEKAEEVKEALSMETLTGKTQILGSPSARGRDSVCHIKGQGLLREFSEGTSFSMELVPSHFEWEAYEIFRKYQMTVHHEQPGQCGEDTYRRFLVDSPLIDVRSSSNPEHFYGSFHMLYRISGRLFAVGVVDVLPRCLSSVYLFYDPDFAKLSPGTLSALKEIEWVKRVASGFPSLRFYYMGYYIHSCPKMRYKAAFYPSEILCDSSKNWIPASEAQHALNTKGEKALTLASPDMKPAAEAANFDITENEVDSLANESKLQIDFGAGGQRVVSLRTLDRLLRIRCPEQLELIRERLKTFVRLVGKASSKFYMHIL